MTNPSTPQINLDQVSAVSPVLARYTAETVESDLWRRDDLSSRDRSLITVASLISRGHPTELKKHIGLALDNGVNPAELSETITQLAIYCGWGNGTTAVMVAGEVFAARGIDAKALPGAAVDLLPLDEEVEAKRVIAVNQAIGDVFPALAQFTTDLLFKDLWLRPGLAPRDRSLVTVAALVTAGQTPQIVYHLNKAMDNGLTQAQAVEVVTHLAFYAGWPNAMSAAGVAKDIFAKRES
ncbi:MULTISPECIES: carboxymuconolactone decarboxylase family protein [Pseudomonas]|uniref:carboxymuconolactone decarboxylase family protein n=1 Tax=Pseudomonas TaxID=286 RepID=UPI001BE7AF00|nr:MULTISPECIES: carboxymuconolactone decarboxylase family protein [Pseudomonas]MBT2341642.1 carboxymuconolactone decarboxylase family protein [Pseudomonas fluorescens]MCD4531111.1 carboxymuconolactone decarboxylase family protein [Pseudomonas sp. C3-2018]